MSIKITIFLLLPFLFVSCISNVNSTLNSKPSNSLIKKQSYLKVPETLLEGNVSRNRAIEHALTFNPKLQSKRAELRALQAETIQAGIRPNPELVFELENFAGKEGNRDLDSAEITTVISQKLELGGKRSKRTIVANLSVEAAKAEVAHEEIMLRITTDQAFTDLLEARYIRELSEKNVDRANKNLNTLNTLFEAGKSNNIDVGKAKLALSEAKELLSDALSTESNASIELSKTWGGGTANVIASGSLNSSILKTPRDIQSIVSKHPAVLASSLYIARSQAIYILEKSKRYSDVNIEGGIREFRDTDEVVAVMGMSIPLPLFDRNQGSIQAAKERIKSAKENNRSTVSNLQSQFAKLHSDLNAAQSRANEFDSQTTAAAQQVLDDTREAYSEGKVSLLEVLDARETLFKIEKGRIKALADLLRASNSIKNLSNQ